MPGPLDNIRLPEAGDAQISASLISMIVAQVKASLNLEGAGAITGPYGASISQRPGAPDSIYARVTAASSTAGFVEWEEVRPNLADEVFETPANGRDFNNYGLLFLPDHATGGFTNGAVIGSIYQVLNIYAEDGTVQRIGAPVGVIGAFDGILGSATLVSGETTRWAYPFSLAKYDSEGTYTAVSGGLTGTAYNKIEAGNTGSGVEGCGINVDNLPTGWELKPIGAGAVVEISVAINCDDQSIEYTFQAVNNADGTCP